MVKGMWLISQLFWYGLLITVEVHVVKRRGRCVVKVKMTRKRR